MLWGGGRLGGCMGGDFEGEAYGWLAFVGGGWQEVLVGEAGQVLGGSGCQAGGSGG